jgi:hypothetical protein
LEQQELKAHKDQRVHSVFKVQRVLQVHKDPKAQQGKLSSMEPWVQQDSLEQRDRKETLEAPWVPRVQVVHSEVKAQQDFKDLQVCKDQLDLLEPPDLSDRRDLSEQQVPSVQQDLLVQQDHEALQDFVDQEGQRELKVQQERQKAFWMQALHSIRLQETP